MARLPAVLLAGALLTACGASPEPLLDRPASFGRAVVWAQGTTLHAGERTFTVPGPVQQVLPTPYGFVLRTDQAGSLMLFDGTTSTRLSDRSRTVRVSPGGRYAGWIDQDGSERPAQAVVVDLRTGATVLRDDDGMGGRSDDLAVLYENADVAFLGFDDTSAYWTVAKGDRKRRRADLRTGKATAVPDGTGQPYDLLRGRRTGMARDGRASADGYGTDGYGIDGLVSPDGRWCLTDGLRGSLPAVDCRTAAKVTPRYPAPDVRFGGWVDDDSYAVLAQARRPEPRPLGPDRSTGVVAVCDLPSGACRTTAEVTATESVVLGSGEPSPYA